MTDGAAPSSTVDAAATRTGPGELVPTKGRVAAIAGACGHGRYRVICEHGRGGLGRVSRAHDHELGRDVAIKELLVRGRISEARFVREARITARLEHPGIVPVYEAGRWPDGTPYYAMKLVSGRPLRDLIAERPSVGERLALLHHVIAVADAMAYAHDRGVVHRDLKPANVIAGAFGETIVIDWGLAKDLSADEDAPATEAVCRDDGRGLTATGSVLGTRQYMPPEQERGEPVDQRADVFAIGAMLWELCAIDKVPPDEPRTRLVRLLRAGVDRDLATIVLKALEPDRARRYRDAGALAADLKAFRAGGRIAARRYSLAARLALWARHHRAQAAAIGAAPLVVLAIAAWGRMSAADARSTTASARAAAAAVLAGRARDLAARFDAARSLAFTRFDAGDPVGGEAAWSDARRFYRDAHAAYGGAAAELEAALLIDPERDRDAMADVLWAHAELAERDHDSTQVTTLLRRLASHAPARASSWGRLGRVTFEVGRAARVSVHARTDAPRASSISGGFTARPVGEAAGARVSFDLAPGSYLAIVMTEDHQVVRDPFVLSREEHLERSISVPQVVVPGFVYIARGRYTSGFGAAHDDELLRSVLGAPPLHRVEIGAYWISRTEVTYQDYLVYLRALLPGEARRLRPASHDVELTESGGRYVLTLEPSTGHRHRAAEGELLVYPGRTVHARVRWETLPVSGLSFENVRAYALWLDQTGRVPGARICTLQEWERAARGADGRRFPAGDELSPTDANIDETYGRIPSAFGPDEVGSFPASDSPFGVADLAGNVWEWTIDPAGHPWYRGGSFYQAGFSALSVNANNPADPSQRNVRIGVRLCADAAAAAARSGP